MSKKATESKLSDLHGIVADTLKDIITRPEGCSAAEMANALRFLKDNGITADLRPGTPLANLAAEMKDDLPFDEEDEIERQRQLFSGATHGRA